MIWMAEGRSRHDWDVASGIMTAVYNHQRTRKDKLVKPWQCNPYAIREAKARRKVTPGIMAAMCGVKFTPGATAPRDGVSA